MERKSHWLRQNAAARMPRRLVVFDTESYKATNLRGSEHSYRCGVASFDLLNAEAQATHPPAMYEGTESVELWEMIARCTSPQHRTVAFAHNISFDVRISGALEALPALGFEWKNGGINNYGFWAHYSDGKRTLMLCDSLSFIPAALEKIAGLVKIAKPPLPDDDAPLEEWLVRCRADVAATREGILRVLAYLKASDCGDFRATGAAQASACFRHRFLREKTLLVHDDSDALEAERRAAWTGRVEVWRHGPVEKRLYEYDFEYAYARIGQEIELPVRLIAGHGGIPYHRLERVMEHYSVLADCDVATSAPIVPTSNGSHIVWSTGSFRSTLWDTEMQSVASSGGTIEVRRYWFYARKPILRAWATWILEELARNPRQLDPVVRLMLKDWSRSLIGRFGLRYQNMEQIARLQTSDVRLFGVYDLDDDKERTYLQLGRNLHERMDRVESPNSTPAIMSAVMSAARVKLWHAMNAAGLENVYYVDTDGLIVSRSGARNLDEARRRNELPGLRRKSVYRGGDFRSPRNLDLDENRRVSGAPRRAERLAQGVYRGEVWESLPAALKRQRGNKVVTREQLFRISEHDPRREHLPDGTTRALSLSLEDDRADAQTA